MPHNHQTTRRFDSELFPGVVVFLKKMTEGRRLTLRQTMAEPNRRLREIIREQGILEKEPEETRDMAKWLELQDEFDSIMLEKINPTWMSWGVKSIEGLTADEKPLTVEDWKEWPSSFFEEVLGAVKAEAELNGLERKNSESPTTSGEPAGSTPTPLTVVSVRGEGGGETEIAAPISPAE